MSAYTDADVSLVANYMPLGFTERDPYRDVDEAARAILDAVAPAIAARAQAAILREIADDYAQVDDSYLSDRADEIEGKS